MDYLKILSSGCDKLDVFLTEQQLMQITNYIELLLKWNKVYNLTAIVNPGDVVIRHVLDSLSIIKFIGNDVNLIDIGSGAGLPGIIIAILKPSSNVTLLDSSNKRTAFLQQVKIKLNLNNIHIENLRVENYKPSKKFDTIIARAFTQLLNYVKLTKHLLLENGTIWAMKGKLQHLEVEEFNNDSIGFKIINVNNIAVPYLDESRHLIEIKRV